MHIVVRSWLVSPLATSSFGPFLSSQFALFISDTFFLHVFSFQILVSTKAPLVIVLSVYACVRARVSLYMQECWCVYINLYFVLWLLLLYRMLMFAFAAAFRSCMVMFLSIPIYP